MGIKDFIQGFTFAAKEYIEKYEAYKDLSGEEKKARVDEVLKTYSETALESLRLNFILKLAFKKLIIDNIPTITQAIFDLLSTKIKGITK